MFKQHCRLSIFLLVLIFVYSVCPLLCAAVGEKFCSHSAEYAKNNHTDDGSHCCDIPKTDETEIPSDDAAGCCSNDLTFVVSNESRADDSSNRLERHHFTSFILSSTIVSTKQDMFLPDTYPFKPFISSLHHVISLRGPPYNLS